jgi:hypothetical protein
MNNRLFHKLTGWPLVVLIIAAGGFLRIFRLGYSSLQIDNIMFWDTFSRDIPIATLFAEWTSLFGLTGQLPLAVVLMKLFVDTFQLSPSFFNMILPFALLGTGMIPVGYALGRELKGHKLGVILAAIVAFHPILIQVSREAYYYAPSLLGSFIALWALTFLRYPAQGQRLPHRFLWINGIAFFLMTWASPSAWSYAFFYVLLIIGVIGYRAIRASELRVQLAIVAGTFGLIGLPLVFADWGLPQILEFTKDGATRDYWVEVFIAGRSAPLFSKLWPVLCSFSFGYGPIRQAALAIMLVGFIWVLRAERKDRWLLISLLGLSLVVLTSNLFALNKSVWSFGMTRALVLNPTLLLILAVTLHHFVSTEKEKFHLIVGILSLIIIASFWVPALVLIPEISGKSRPYQAIANWADQELAPGTPIITDRFFTAYNEFRVHAPTSVVFMSIVGNQIPAEYERNQFRERTLAFLDRHRDAAFYEEQHLWNHPDGSAWTNIHDRFSSKHTVTNRAGIDLAKMGLLYRAHPEVEPDPAKYSCTIWYNTEADILERAKAENEQLVPLFSSGWNILSTRDGRQWRVMQDRGDIAVWNLTPSPITATMIVTGVAAGGKKQVRAADQQLVQFPQDQIITWRLPQSTYPPGKSIVSLKGSPESARIPLLVFEVGTEP